MDKLQSKINRLNDEDTGFKAVSAAELETSGLKDITLRPYQLDGVNWLIERYHRNHGCILGDEMGLGKTCQTIAFLTHLHGSLDVSGPFLILCPLSVLRNWQEELKRFSPDLEVLVYVGDKEKRQEVRHSVRRCRDFHVLLSTYEICLKDESFLRRFEWQALVVDEAHRLKNQNSLLHQTLKEFTIHYHLLLTGTPVQNNMEELFSLLHFVAPSLFKQHYMEDFVDRYSAVDNDSSSVRQELHTILQPFLLRRVKSEVIKDLPKKSEVIVYHGLTALQKKYYKAILMKDMDAFQTFGPLGPSKTRLMNILMQLRKCVNHPYLFDGVEPEPFELGEHLIEASGKLFLLDQLLSYLKKKGHKVLVFSQMTRVLDILQDYLGYRGYSYERLDGSVRGEERYLAIQNFNQQDDVFVFLLSTRAGGQGLNLASADTVIFMDSDFNPQNDLQAAARAHRIGQTRPVKIIRLIGRSTVEEIILKRAEAKLKLTNSVIEGGQLSGLNSVADNGTQLSDILKFGLDKLFETEESLESLGDTDLETMLGGSHHGNWVLEDITTSTASQEEQEEKEEEEEETAHNMYVFEGKDYSKEPSADDLKAFETLVAVQASLEEDTLSEDRKLRKKKPPLVSLAALPTRKRKQLTPEELEERRKKREEAAAKRAKLQEEAEVRRAQVKKERREAMWKSHGYTTCNIAMETDEEESDEEVTMVTDDDDDDDRRAINYVMGDVTHPQCTGDQDAIVVHCVDDSGSWGQGGLFSALSARSSQPEMQYELAGKMKDLALGDAHLIAVDDRESRPKGSDMVALIVAQSRDRNNRLSGIKLSALNQGLGRICTAAKRMKASVHLPRIGYNTPGFNWYGTERLIRKHLASRGVNTYIYYYPRKNKKQAITKTTGAGASTSQHTTSTTTGTAHTTLGNPLPDFMQGVMVFFQHVTDEQRRKYTRYLVAYDGDVHESPTEDTTHVVVGSHSSEDDQVLQQVVADCTEAAVVSTRWLDECLSRGRKVAEEPHKID
ncbi:chromodomain-helicase-DNA-binding protein 1-like [Branchiostoma floridae]|uniref:Chromodomain-helicase-DNA-binding protein 1-like n=1 Tax=Branchiostoma floridae TaxID=7739 RepID=A0A9J7LS52_BRAFL|nr:chromodomain-helicase-DNA-binding protein 1-like [Branchiostoma floridae]